MGVSKRLQATFLKNEVGGVILAATSRDPNNQMFPIAHAIVTKENTEMWTWFLNCLLEALDSQDDMKSFQV